MPRLLYHYHRWDDTREFYEVYCIRNSRKMWVSKFPSAILNCEARFLNVLVPFLFTFEEELAVIFLRLAAEF